MTIIGLPSSYSDMLKRLFWSSIAVGLLCTVLLASASPGVKEVLDSIDTEAGIGPLKALKVLYVIIPFAIAIVSRILKLHDRISDLLRIRIRFDVKYILSPLANLVGHNLGNEMSATIRQHRRSLMYEVFYPYAGYDDPKIPKHLVFTALDDWGWFWVASEASTVLLVTAVLAVFLHAWWLMALMLSFLLLCALLGVLKWNSCKASAGEEVKSILSDLSRHAKIREYFDALPRTGTGNPNRERREAGESAQ